MSSQIGVGLIGYGLSGRVFHTPLVNASPDFKMISVVTKSHELDGLLSDPHVQLVIITSPNRFHEEHTLRALNAGKHVLCEKPFTLNSQSALELGKLARSKNLILSVFHNRRFDSDHLTIKKLLRSESLGEPSYFESQMDRLRVNVGQKWKETADPGAGVLFDLGSHLIDQSNDLFGFPESVSAHLGQQRNGAMNTDFFSVRLIYKSGLVSQLRSSSFASLTSHKSLLYGTNGTAVVTGLDPQEQQLQSGMSPHDPEFGKGCIEILASDIHGQKLNCETLPGSYMEFIRQLHQAILGKCAAPTDAFQAAKTALIIEAATQSHIEQKSIQLTLPEELR